MINIMNRKGEIYFTNNGSKIEIIEYFSSLNATIKIDDNILQYNVRYDDIINGNIKNKVKPTIYDIGFIGYGEYKSKINGKQTESYRKWFNVLNRCYSEKYLLKFPTYNGCSVCDEWKNFQIFAKWFDKNNIPEFDLDKDLLMKNNKIYSPQTCCFLPKEINSLLLTRKKVRGVLYIGVTYHKKNKKYVASLTIDGKRTHLGYFNTEESAFKVYKEAKEDNIKRMANKYKNTITDEAYIALIDYQVEIYD